MKLTGKTLEAFEVFALEYFRKTREDYNKFTDAQVLGKFNRMSEIFQNSLIVEFLDAQKIFINIKSKFGSKKQRMRFSYSLISFNVG
jgi:DNA-binding MltR family transcriptional regulator